MTQNKTNENKAEHQPTAAATAQARTSSRAVDAALSARFVLRTHQAPTHQTTIAPRQEAQLPVENPINQKETQDRSLSLLIRGMDLMPRSENP